MKPESRFEQSRQNPECPHPEYWHSPDRSSTECEVSELIAAFVRALQPELVLETGTCRGYTSYEIGKALHRNGHGRLIGIEPNKRMAELTRVRCHGLPVEVLECSSLDYEPPDVLDICFFDSVTQVRLEEFAHFHRWIHRNTLLMWHDTSSVHLEIHNHVTYLARSGELEWILPLPTPRGITIARAVKAAG